MSYLTQGHFNVDSHTWIETHARQVKKMLYLVGIPLLECLRHQAMCSVLQSRYCLGDGPWYEAFSFLVIRPKRSGAKLCKGNLIKRINTWTVSLVKYYVPLLRLTKCIDKEIYNDAASFTLERCQEKLEEEDLRALRIVNATILGLEKYNRKKSQHQQYPI